MAPASIDVNFSATEEWTRNRLAAVQASPALRILATMAPSSAASRSASSNTMKGVLPPSSIDTLSTWSAATLSRVWPTSVDPVNDSLRTRGSCSICSITPEEPLATTTLTTPGGSPAASMRWTTARVVRGVSDAGFTMAVQPAARAGPILRVAMAAGKFHGVIITLTPTGWSTVMILLSPAGARRTSPPIRGASSENQRKNSAAYRTSPRASGNALPFSRTMSSARSSSRWRIASKVRRRISARSRGAVDDHGPSAPAAASTASPAWLASARPTSINTSSVAGSTTGSSPAPADQEPPM